MYSLYDIKLNDLVQQRWQQKWLAAHLIIQSPEINCQQFAKQYISF